tara:strand:- start:169 stop:348 length:180 start_codon:yes stop_codon:yes gene_type:complete
MNWNNLRGSAIREKNQVEKFDFNIIDININIVVQKELDKYNKKIIPSSVKNKYGEWIVK